MGPRAAEVLAFRAHPARPHLPAAPPALHLGHGCVPYCTVLPWRASKEHTFCGCDPKERFTDVLHQRRGRVASVHPKEVPLPAGQLSIALSCNVHPLFPATVQISAGYAPLTTSFHARLPANACVNATAPVFWATMQLWHHVPHAACPHVDRLMRCRLTSLPACLQPPQGMGANYHTSS